MIQILTRVQYPELYQRMMDSARATARGNVQFASMPNDGQPRVVETYNLLASLCPNDMLVFCEDDIIFLSEGWDVKMQEALNLGFNVVGAVGTQKYDGGLVFDSGKQYSAGKIVGWVDGKRVVKLMDNRSEIEPVAVVDGSIMAVDRAHFIKSGGFDLKLDGLFYYDADFCLRSNCAVVDILVAHEKPEHLRGKYPADMKPIEAYRDYFNSKHGFNADPPIGDQRCDSILFEDYKEAACL